MKAIIYDEYGSADVLQFVDRELPKPSGRQMLIRVAACSVNPIDRRDLRELIHLWSSDKLRVVRNEVFPLSEARAAHRHGEDGHGTGKIVLTIN